MIATLLATAILVTAAPPPGESQLDDPCLDTLYVALKEKGIDALSTREWEIFQQKDDACTRYRLLRSRGVAPDETPRPIATPPPSQATPTPPPLPLATPTPARPAVPAPIAIEPPAPLPEPPGLVMQGALALEWGANDVDRRGLLLGAASAGIGLLDHPQRGRWTSYFGGGADVTWGGSDAPGRHRWSAGLGTRMGIAKFGGLARVPDATLAVRTTPILAGMEDGVVGGVRVAGSIAVPAWPASWIRRRPCGFTFAPLAVPTSYLELGVESYGPRFEERVSFFYARLGAGF